VRDGSSVLEWIEQKIITGTWAVGEKLPSERHLAEEFGVSRPVVREALRSLSARNFVEIWPGRGAFVRNVSTTDAAYGLSMLFRRFQITSRDFVEARSMIEGTSAALAAERHGESDAAAMERALLQFERAPGIIEEARADMAFHMAIARAARNPMIETLLGSITSLIVELMLRSLGDPEVTRVSVPFHRVIFSAITERDSERARTAMTDHLAVAATHYGEDYDRNLDSVARRELTRLFSPGFTLDDLLDATVGGET
jgi:GntR family transcriptional repressor for pyruvate dehydrogenase complex